MDARIDHALTPAYTDLPSTRYRFAFWYIKCAGAIFLITGLAKIVSALGSAKVLALSDPIFHVSFGHLMFIAGIIELAVAYICLFRRSTVMPETLVLWISTMLLGCRIGLAFIGWHTPCICLGTFTGALHVSSNTADTAMKWILGYLIAGSYLCLAQRLLDDRVQAKAA